jgi:hypothetical protein
VSGRREKEDIGRNASKKHARSSPRTRLTSTTKTSSPRAEAGAVRAKLLMRERRYAEAAQTAGEALALARRSEYVDVRRNTLLTFAEVLDAMGRREEEAELVIEAVELWDFKGNVCSRRGRGRSSTRSASRLLLDAQ